MASSRGACFSGSRRLLCASLFPTDDKKVRLIGRLLSLSEVLSKSSSVDTRRSAALRQPVACVLQLDCVCARTSHTLEVFQSARARPAVCTAAANAALCVLVAAKLIANCQA